MSSWRMNGLWRRMARVLMLCALLLSDEVTCQDDVSTASPNMASTAPATDAAVTTTAPATGMSTALLSKHTQAPMFQLSIVTLSNVIQEMKEVPVSSSGSSVFVGVLVTGLLAALAITVGYFKCQRRSGPKDVKLAEEAYPVDQENQGNTLVSVAPLNPPPETQEKPSINGESTEPAKTEPPRPPTNGHSATKTADTEL